MSDELKHDIGSIISKKTNDFIEELSGSKIEHRTRMVDNVVVFMGGHGGTGCSTLVTNVAFAASQKKLSVLVIDLNIQYPIQHSPFRCKQKVNKKDLVSFLLGQNSIGDSIDYSDLKGIGVLYANNRNLIDYITCDSSLASRNLIEALKQIRSLFDLIIIDCPMNIEHDIINNVVYYCDRLYTVWDESLACIANIERFKRNLAAVGIDNSKIDLIINKKTNVHYPKSAYSSFGLEPIGILPFDTSIIEASLRAEVFINKGASASKNAQLFYKRIYELTDKILENGGVV